MRRALVQIPEEQRTLWERMETDAGAYRQSLEETDRERPGFLCGRADQAELDQIAKQQGLSEGRRETIRKTPEENPLANALCGRA
ncbi:MAG: hypothetical protein M2R45_04476 [Verrucomicrobia subdivision 3 bacterium]|nr:hypothetical protein [Limisphaerales bacterium]MCS1411278.1 hypothetical protein [Limisphaerales bacterium]MCS1412681.1 hypothetical protein [Limisphaerales bacterium]MCS1414421.1 hypothetical protein [Limisphaerales bacterium]